MGYMFQIYGVIFRPSKTTDPILHGSQVHCGIPNAYIVLIVTIWNHIYYLIILANITIISTTVYGSDISQYY